MSIIPRNSISWQAVMLTTSMNVGVYTLTFYNNHHLLSMARNVTMGMTFMGVQKRTS